MTRHHQPPSQVLGARAPEDLAAEQESLRARIQELEQQTSTLREGLDSRQDIGFITGVLAQRYGLDPDQAWQLLARTSQHLNVKARQVAQVLLDVYCGRLDPVDIALAAGITRLLPTVPVSGKVEPTTDLTHQTGRTAEATYSHQDRR